MFQICMYTALPKLRMKTLALAVFGIFLIKSHLGSRDWADLCSGLCILKLLHIMSSWFRENVIQVSKVLKYRQGCNIIFAINWEVLLTYS